MDAHLFTNMEEVKNLSEEWKEDYNENHPHGSLGGKSPRKYLKEKIEEINLNNIQKSSKRAVS